MIDGRLSNNIVVIRVSSLSAGYPAQDRQIVIVASTNDIRHISRDVIGIRLDGIRVVVAKDNFVGDIVIDTSDLNALFGIDVVCVGGWFRFHLVSHGDCTIVTGNSPTLTHLPATEEFPLICLYSGIQFVAWCWVALSRV